MGHVNPAACQLKDSWRWQTSNSEYGKFYVRKVQREVKQEAQNECFKKCEELTNELQEAKDQLQKLKLLRDRHICGPVRSHDEACQTSPTSPRRQWTTMATKPGGPPNRKLCRTETKNNSSYGREGHDDPQMLLDQGGGNAHRVNSERQKLPLLSLPHGRNNGGGDDQDNGERGIQYSCNSKQIAPGCGLRCLLSRNSSSSGSANDGEQVSPRKRKILQKHRGAPKKQKAATGSDLKHTAAGGANLPPSQRYSFYKNFGYGGQGAKTSKGWHSMKSPWLPS